MIEYILKNVFSIFRKEKVKLIIYYGNKQGEDIDIFLITSGESEYNCIHQGRFDITYIGEKYLEEMIKHLDPLLTEPILSGNVIYGNMSNIKNALNEVCVSENIINYLLNKSLLYFQWANAHFQNGDLIYTCNCVRFSLSFYYFARHYKKAGVITTFSTLFDNLRNDRTTIEMATKMAKSQKKLTFKNVEHILTETHQILTKG